MFGHVRPYPGDPILGLMERFLSDARREKVNLGIGIYFDETGRLPVMETVAAVEQMRYAAPQPRGYLSMEGLAEYRLAVQELLFGGEAAALARRTVTVQTLGGSGALKLGADFLHDWFGGSRVYVSDPTWDNHQAIFAGAGFAVDTYPYYDAACGGVRFEAMLDCFARLPRNSVVVLHPCCHNPTGVDLSRDQWDQVLAVAQARGLIPFMDMAYQGFGDGLHEDAYALRRAVGMGLTVWVANSFSKNMGLYGERVGGLSVVCATAAEAETVLGRLKFGVRRLYSSPPLHGAWVAARVLNTPKLRAGWENELAQMRRRIGLMRGRLAAALAAQLPGCDFAYLTAQRGMFGYTGLNPVQVGRLQAEFAVYLVENGRMCVAGLNEANVDYVARAMGVVWRRAGSV